MAAERRWPSPLPASCRDQLESDLRAVPVEHRWRIRRIVEDFYAVGFREGHMVGDREARSDIQDEARALSAAGG